MKRIVWFVVDKSDEVLAEYTTRQRARNQKGFYENHIFEDWMEGVSFPLKIVREEWELKDRKVVR